MKNLWGGLLHIGWYTLAGAGIAPIVFVSIFEVDSVGNSSETFGERLQSGLEFIFVLCFIGAVIGFIAGIVTVRNR
jgi:hypothetical protein